MNVYMLIYSEYVTIICQCVTLKGADTCSYRKRNLKCCISNVTLTFATSAERPIIYMASSNSPAAAECTLTVADFEVLETLNLVRSP